MFGYQNTLVVRPQGDDVYLTVNQQRVILTPTRARELCHLLQWAIGVIEAEKGFAAFLSERLKLDAQTTRAALGEWKTTREAQRIIRVAKHEDRPGG